MTDRHLWESDCSIARYVLGMLMARSGYKHDEYMVLRDAGVIVERALMEARAENRKSLDEGRGSKC